MADSYRDLVAWQKAMQLAKATYDLTSNFPREETYGLTSQMRRAAVSVPSNIAEGQARHYKPEFVRFLRHAKASVAELETQAQLAAMCGFLDERGLKAYLRLTDEVSRIIAGLIASMIPPEER